MLYILHAASSRILKASPKELCYHLIAQRRKPRLRIVGTVPGTQLVRDRALLLASPSGAVRDILWTCWREPQAATCMYSRDQDQAVQFHTPGGVTFSIDSRPCAKYNRGGGRKSMRYYF